MNPIPLIAVLGLGAWEPGTALPPEDPCRAAGLSAAAGSLPPPPSERGVALGLFSLDPEWDGYPALVDEAKAHGATHLSVVWVWWQEDLRATRIYAKPRWSATEAQLLETLAHARDQGLHVTLFPIVRLVAPKPGEWRGRITPDDEDAWWASYDAFILRAAALAAHARVDRLSVGSELLTREGMRPRWRALIERIRLRHSRLELMYSANWDHFEPVRFWDLVDVAGVTAYYEVGPVRDPQLDRLIDAWKEPRSKLLAFREGLARPLVVTEVGYPSLQGGLRWPWNETRRASVDLEAQRLGYEAYVRAVGGALDGTYFWNWFGFGGSEDGNYTPRGKPAANVMACWFGLLTRSPARVESPTSR